MPEISRFFGILIKMFYRDHAPPHFHAEFGEYKILVEIESGVVEGRFPRKALNLVHEWLDLHREELLKDWKLALDGKTPEPIKPLE